MNFWGRHRAAGYQLPSCEAVTPEFRLDLSLLRLHSSFLVMFLQRQWLMVQVLESWLPTWQWMSEQFGLITLSYLLNKNCVSTSMPSVLSEHPKGVIDEI